MNGIRRMQYSQLHHRGSPSRTFEPMPSQSARSCALATAVDSPTKRTSRAVCAAMYRMRDTMTSRIGPLRMQVETRQLDPDSSGAFARQCRCCSQGADAGSVKLKRCACTLTLLACAPVVAQQVYLIQHQQADLRQVDNQF